MTHTQIYQIFIARRYASAVYIVCWPCVSLSVRQVRGRKTARRQIVQKDPHRDVVVHAAYTDTDAQQWRGRSIHANNRVANVQALPCFSSH